MGSNIQVMASSLNLTFFLNILFLLVFDFRNCLFLKLSSKLLSCLILYKFNNEIIKFFKIRLWTIFYRSICAASSLLHIYSIGIENISFFFRFGSGCSELQWLNLYKSIENTNQNPSPKDNDFSDPYHFPHCCIYWDII